MTWTESTDNAAVAGYRIYRNGGLVADVTDGSGTFVDDGLDDGVTHSYRARAYDAASNLSGLSSPAPVTTPDVTAPGPPVNLRAASTPQSVALTWGAAADNVGVTNYVVYRDGLPVATLDGTATGWTDNALVGSTLHRYRVTARDAAEHESEPSNEVARTLSDTTVPSAPTLFGSRSGFTVRLTWSGATDDVGVTGYTILRAGVAIGTTTGSAYTDTSPPLARASSYTVRARDAAGNISASSNSVSVSVPADTTPPSSPTGLRRDGWDEAGRTAVERLQRQLSRDQLLLVPREHEVPVAGQRDRLHGHRPDRRHEVHLQGLCHRRGGQLEWPLQQRQRNTALEQFARTSCT